MKEFFRATLIFSSRATMITIAAFSTLFLVGLVLGWLVLAFYQHTFVLSRGDIVCFLPVLALLYGILLAGHYPVTLWSGVFLMLLVAGCVTDALRSWLPFPLIIPTLISALLLVYQHHPGHLHDALLWSALWGCLHAGRLAWQIVNHHPELPGSGDIFLVAVTGAVAGPASVVLLGVGVLSHTLFCLVSRRRVAPLGPFLFVPVLAWVSFFF